MIFNYIWKTRKEPGVYPTLYFLYCSLYDLMKVLKTIPYYFDHEGFPEDDYKSTVCFNIENQFGDILYIFDYKCWNYNDTPIDIEECEDWRIWTNNSSLYKELRQVIYDQNRKARTMYQELD